MDFAKLVWMLQNGALYFPRLDQLADPFEGTLSRSEFERIRTQAAQLELVPDKLPAQWRGKFHDVLMLNARRARHSMYVNCWHLSPHESEAMWRLYSASEYSVAIESTYDRLVEALPAKLHNGCFVGLVRYLNYHHDPMPENNSFNPVMHKRSAFVHENEVRAVVWLGDPGVGARESLEDNPLGLLVPVTLSDLVARVVIAPTAPKWFDESVIGVMDKYLPGTPVVRSALLDEPYI